MAIPLCTGTRGQNQICPRVLLPSLKPTFSSFHVVFLARTTKKCTKTRNARAVRAKLLFFLFLLNMHICGGPNSFKPGHGEVLMRQGLHLSKSLV